jgi:hypothetical protein
VRVDDVEDVELGSVAAGLHVGGELGDRRRRVGVGLADRELHLTAALAAEELAPPEVGAVLHQLHERVSRGQRPVLAEVGGAELGDRLLDVEGIGALEEGEDVVGVLLGGGQEPDLLGVAPGEDRGHGLGGGGGDPGGVAEPGGVAGEGGQVGELVGGDGVVVVEEGQLGELVEHDQHHRYGIVHLSGVAGGRPGVDEQAADGVRDQEPGTEQERERPDELEPETDPRPARHREGQGDAPSEGEQQGERAREPGVAEHADHHQRPQPAQEHQVQAVPGSLAGQPHHRFHEEQRQGHGQDDHQGERHQVHRLRPAGDEHVGPVPQGGEHRLGDDDPARRQQLRQPAYGGRTGCGWGGGGAGGHGGRG